jgi:hypothetical protein
MPGSGGCGRGPVGAGFRGGISMSVSIRNCLRSARLTESCEEPEADELDSKETLSVTFSDEAMLVAKELPETAEVGSFSSSLESSCKSNRSLIQPCGPAVGL